MAQGFNKERCSRRNYIAARRDGIDAVPLRFLRDPSDAAAEAGLLYAHGTLPNSIDGTLAAINSRLPEGAKPLGENDIYAHRIEAANGNFIPDRYMFIDDSTLRNIAKEATAGAAFMNSHRTGGLSTPAELPMGFTFAGRYEQYRDGTKRTVMGVYLLRGQSPNGASGPSTDDLHTAIEGGTIADVSVGMFGGERICDVCGNGVNDWDPDQGYSCNHAPGTTRRMTEEEIAAQKARGVPDGVASYSIVDAHLSEVSAVFDGAVPGAGFRKCLSLSGSFSERTAGEARRAYSALLQDGGTFMDHDAAVAAGEGIGEGLSRALSRDSARPAPAPTAAQANDQLAAMQEQLAAMKEQLASERRRNLEQRTDAWVKEMQYAGHVLPSEAPTLKRLHLQSSIDDAENPVEGTSRVSLISELYSTRKANCLTGELMPAGAPAGAYVLANPATTEDGESKAAEVAAEAARKWKMRNAGVSSNGKGH